MTAYPASIDLNADLGEGFGPWRMGDDAALLGVVTSANVACGFHAGDPDIMTRVLMQAREAGVAVGAHVAFPDIAGFGRRILPMSAAEIARAVAYQIGAAQALATFAGHRLSHVKVHGALANLAEHDAAVADAIAEATRAVDPSLTLLAIARSEQTRAGERAGLRVAHEIFADRAYANDGRLRARALPGAVIHDVDVVIARVRQMLAAQALITIDGELLPTPIDSICVHGDTPQAVALAQALRHALENDGVALRPFVTN
jgi:5-oxoprolinase (ATP-hydrolysing) subunit A